MRIVIVIISMLLVPLPGAGQAIARINANQLKAKIESGGDSIRIYNFWATWCAPCVKEMPLFEAYQLAHPEVALTFVSLDLQLDPDPAKVARFVARKKISSRVVILDDNNPNAWIDKIEKRWTGALPATLVINPKTGKRAFEEKEFKPGDLDALVDSVK